MSTSNVKQSQLHDRRGSFFKLIDSFAWEIGTLKKEMGNKTEPTEVDNKADALLGLSEEVGGLFLQLSPSGMGSGLARARDSGYDSISRRMSVLDRLTHTHAVWLQLGLSHQDAARILQSQPAGAFVVRKSSSLQRKVISLRMNKDSAFPVKDFPVKESQYTFSLEGSGLSFADLFRLVAFCCISRDVLPFTLKLPEAIASAKTAGDLEEVARLGSGFWDSHLCQSRKSSVPLSGTAAPDKPPPPVKRLLSLGAAPGRPPLRTRTPSELECCQANGALCFINPLFIRVHQPESNHSNSTTPSGTVQQSQREESVNINSHKAKNTDAKPLKTNTSQAYDSDHSDGSHSVTSSTPTPQSLGINKDTKNNTSQTTSTQNLTITNSLSRSAPPRPPPPRFTPQQSDPSLCRQRSMPEKIYWINPPKEKMEERERSPTLLSRLASFSISSSSSPPKIFSISSPIPIHRPSLPLSLSTSPQRTKSSPSSSQEDAQCHLALEDKAIENALTRAKLSWQRATPTTARDANSPPDDTLLITSKQVQVQGERGDVSEECSGGGQRLSDMSLSTDSSDSLDLSQSSAFFLPPLYDPSPPSAADYTIHLPLSYLPYFSTEEDDEEGDDEDEQEPDYGVNLESDQDLTMEPPRHPQKRRTSIVIQKAIQGKLRNFSGVFQSLMTPEKRMIRRVVELSKDKRSYFGSLVQDYLSYMGEGAGTQAWQAHTSGLELLQTLRQFITQMKSYLCQSSELDPPIESLIPEDQIDLVLEKAMHKCVLKPLKPIVSVALQEFQERSGAWQELKENLLLAKARQPQELGVVDVSPPDASAIQKIKRQFHIMCKYYSPEKKVAELLAVCKLIYTIMENNSGRLYGADDFLPVLTYVLAQCDMPQLDNEILYMMELLDPSLLQGEGGYYLTSAYGAMSLIRNFQEAQAARALSSETRSTLRQWHRRRTTQRSTPSIDDFQNFLRVALQELDSGCTAKTLQVRPYATVEDVCQLCAHKFKVSHPENYGLFLVTEGSSQQLAPDTHPQKIKAELHSRPQAAPFYFVFRRLANQNTSSSAPLNPAPSLSVTSDPQANLSDLSTSPPSPQPSLSLGLSRSLSLSLPPSHLNGNSISI